MVSGFLHLWVSLWQCRSGENGNFLRSEHCAGKGEGRRDPRRLSDGEELTTTEAAYGADTGKGGRARSQGLAEDILGAQFPEILEKNFPS